MVRLLVLTLLSMPVLAQQTDLDAAFRGASLRAGMWVASLSQTEQAMFPRGVRALYLNIWMTVDGEKPPARTELVKRVAGPGPYISGPRHRMADQDGDFHPCGGPRRVPIKGGPGTRRYHNGSRHIRARWE